MTVPPDRAIYPADLAERLSDRAGKKYRPSNGLEGEIFQANWCAACQCDAAFRADPNNADGCPIIAGTMALDVDDEDYPSEWQYGPDGQPRCTAFTTADKDRLERCLNTFDLFGSPTP